jgi:hypothetical protein
MVISDATGFVPGHGPVTWDAAALDHQARAWLDVHRPESAGWLSIVTRDDTRQCTGCKKGVLWQACQYALWARTRQSMQAANGVSPRTSGLVTR